MDIGDKVRAQRVAWLCRLLEMPRDSFPRALADYLIGDQGVGYVGLGVLAADLGMLQVRTRTPFYQAAVDAWAKLTPRVRVDDGEVGCDRPVVDCHSICLYSLPRFALLLA